MRKHTFYIRTFTCPECGFSRPASKSTGNRTAAGHVKHMFCPRCNKTTGFVQKPEFEENNSAEQPWES